MLYLVLGYSKVIIFESPELLIYIIYFPLILSVAFMNILQYIPDGSDWLQVIFKKRV